MPVEGKIFLLANSLLTDKLTELKNGLPRGQRKHSPFPESMPVTLVWSGQQRDSGQPGPEVRVPGLGCVVVYTNGGMHFLVPWVLGCTDSSRCRH